MELITQTIAAGQVCNFERAGTYFEIIDAYGRLNVKLNGQGGVQADEMRNALSGFYSEESFSGFTIENPETYAQDIAVMVSDKRGGSRRQRGDVSIVDQIKDAAQTVSNDASAPTAFAVSTFLDPGANTRGAVVLGASATLLPTSAGWAKCRILAAKVAPVSMAAAAGQVLLADAYSRGENIIVSEDWNMRRRLPAGWGIFMTWQVDTGVLVLSGRATFQAD